MKTAMLLLALAVLLAASVGVADAQSGGGYDQSWYTIDGGGVTFSTGSGYQLGSTIGQPDAGTLTNGGYTLLGGFWGGSAAQYRIYLPIALK